MKLYKFHQDTCKLCEFNLQHVKNNLYMCCKNHYTIKYNNNITVKTIRNLPRSAFKSL